MHPTLDLEKIFLPHKVNDTGIMLLDQIDRIISFAARELGEVTTLGAEQTLMYRKLQEAQYWARMTVRMNEDFNAT